MIFSPSTLVERYHFGEDPGQFCDEFLLELRHFLRALLHALRSERIIPRSLPRNPRKSVRTVGLAHHESSAASLGWLFFCGERIFRVDSISVVPDQRFLGDLECLQGRHQLARIPGRLGQRGVRILIIPHRLAAPYRVH